MASHWPTPAAAPYKHFRDKQEILEEIVLRGFEELSAANAKAVMKGGPGTIAGITAMGISYLEFALAQPSVFRLMFGHKSEIRKAKQVGESSKRCLKHVIDEVATYGSKHGHTTDAEVIALRLWTFMLGASSLELDDDYERCAFRRRRPLIPTHGDHLFQPMATRVARAREGAVGCMS
jgi:AcrR family transcriptional regulator